MSDKRAGHADTYSLLARDEMDEMGRPGGYVDTVLCTLQCVPSKGGMVSLS